MEVMDVKSSLDHVRKLIETYPDVRVQKAKIVGDFSLIEFNTSSISTLSRIAYAAWASNVRVDVVPPRSFHYGYGEEMNSSELYYQMNLEHVMGDYPPPSTLQTFGIFIARDLEALGLISQEKLDFLWKKSWSPIE